ncbi:hypothetical protein DXG01_004580 [Tephrocybe rancida]|nr:hypothetical protein DXG01_004580 [Tephrocybe rancida]
MRTTISGITQAKEEVAKEVIELALSEDAVLPEEAEVTLEGTEAEAEVLEEVPDLILEGTQVVTTEVVTREVILPMVLAAMLPVTPAINRSCADMCPDSRRFNSPRLLSAAGYDSAPAVDDRLTFTLPPFNQHSGRIVGVYEQWSPNSMLYAFYPGVPPPGLKYTIPEDPSARRFDGHLGQFDYTVNPQVLQKDFAWRALIYRPSVGKELSLVEYESVYDHWETEPTRAGEKPRFGRVSPTFLNKLDARATELELEILGREGFAESYYNYLWTTRPKGKQHDDIRKLRECETFEEALDLGTAVSRSLKEKDAWKRMVGALTKQSWKDRVLQVRTEGVKLALNDCIGCWINGNLEDNTLLLINLLVPCYVVHELQGDGSYGTERQMSLLGENFGWTEGTDAELLSRRTYYPDHIARDNGSEPAMHYSKLVEDPPLAPEADRRRLSARSQGWMGDVRGKDKTLPFVPKPCPPPPRSPTPPPAPLDPHRERKLRADPITRVRLYPGRIEWIKPPPIETDAGVKGKWRKWTMRRDGSFIQEATGWNGGYDNPIAHFDRRLKREFVLEERLTIPAGVVSDVSHYGMPAPDMHYWETETKRAKASRWLYSFRLPRPNGKGGQEAPIPSELDLPAEPEKTTNEVPAPDVKGKKRMGRPPTPEMEEILDWGGEEDSIAPPVPRPLASQSPRRPSAAGSLMQVDSRRPPPLMSIPTTNVTSRSNFIYTNAPSSRTWPVILDTIR